MNNFMWQPTLAVRHRPSMCVATFPGVSFLKADCFWLRWVSTAAHRLSLVGVRGPLIAVASLVAEHGL